MVREPFSDRLCSLGRSRDEIPGRRKVQITVFLTDVIDPATSVFIASLSVARQGKAGRHHLNKSQISTGAGMSVGAKL